jgi:YesN/AraC family two-component response regulator
LAKILIIDDEEMVRDVLRQTLEREGYHVEAAADGERGLALFQSWRPDLVITDILMPGKEGLETIRELRAEDPDVQIIAISGGGDRGDLNFLRAASMFGAVRTLSKPISRDDLLPMVRDIVGDPTTH